MTAEAKLRDAGAPLPSLRYIHFTETLMRNTIESNSKLIELDVDVKATFGLEYIERTKLPVVDILGSKYSWMRYISIKFGRELSAKVVPVCPFVGWDDKIANLVTLIGLSRSRDIFRMHPEALLSIIRRDKNFPRYIRAETLFKELTKPSIIIEPSRILNTCIAMGLDPNIASQLVTKIFKDSDRFKMMTEGIMMSTNDQIIGSMDLGRSTYDRLVHFIDTGDQILNAVLSVLGLGLVFDKYMSEGKLYDITMTYTDLGKSMMMTEFTGKSKRYTALRFLNLFQLPRDK